jgi:hypothetical protein
MNLKLQVTNFDIMNNAAALYRRDFLTILMHGCLFPAVPSTPLISQASSRLLLTSLSTVHTTNAMSGCGILQYDTTILDLLSLGAYLESTTCWQLGARPQIQSRHGEFKRQLTCPGIWLALEFSIFSASSDIRV